jgi:hypothetical protein
MKRETTLPIAVLLLASPLVAHAQSIPHIEALYSFGGGFAGGLLGALLACWLCHRNRDSKNETSSKR